MKADFKIGGEEIRKGTWLMTVEISDVDIWEKIKKSEISGFSMGGVGEYSEEDVDLNELDKTVAEKAEKRGILTNSQPLLDAAPLRRVLLRNFMRNAASDHFFGMPSRYLRMFCTPTTKLQIATNMKRTKGRCGSAWRISTGSLQAS